MRNASGLIGKKNLGLWVQGEKERDRRFAPDDLVKSENELGEAVSPSKRGRHFNGSAQEKRRRV